MVSGGIGGKYTRELTYHRTSTIAALRTLESSRVDDRRDDRAHPAPSSTTDHLNISNVVPLIATKLACFPLEWYYGSLDEFCQEQRWRKQVISHKGVGLTEVSAFPDISSSVAQHLSFLARLVSAKIWYGITEANLRRDRQRKWSISDCSIVEILFPKHSRRVA